MRISRALLLLALMTGAACAPSGHKPAAVDTKAEEAKLMDASRRWSTLAAEGKDVDAVAAYWTEDAVLMQEGVPTIRGRDGARRMVEGAFKVPGFKVEWEPLEAHVAESGDMGYLIERSMVTEPGPEGKPVTSEARAVTVWRKGADGQWRNAVDISNAEVKGR
jgi:ketosteroid isomerase-like protein